MTRRRARVLAADVGGTHTRIATYELRGEGRPVPVRQRSWPSQERDGLQPLLEAYLREANDELVAACIALAGPVRGGRSVLTNVGWEIDRDALAAAAGLPELELVNDFVAIGHGIGALLEDEVEVLREGSSEPEAPVCVLGPGTGLGVAWMDPATDTVHPSEGGHADFAPWDNESRALAAHLRRRDEHVSWERVVSGRGLVEIYGFVTQEAPSTGSGSVQSVQQTRGSDSSGSSGRAGGSDRPAAISKRGLTREDAHAEHALELFCRALGVFAGQCVLTFAALGGVYLAGGIVPEILPMLREGGPFLGGLGARGRMREYAGAVPVRAILNDEVGLMGAARLAAARVGGRS